MIDEIETPFDPIQAKFDTIDTPVDPSDAHFHGPEPLLHIGHSNLEVAHVLNDPVQLGVYPTQHHEHKIVGFVSHDAVAIAPYSAAIKVAPGWLARRVR